LVFLHPCNIALDVNGDRYIQFNGKCTVKSIAKTDQNRKKLQKNNKNLLAKKGLVFVNFAVFCDKCLKVPYIIAFFVKLLSFFFICNVISYCPLWILTETLFLRYERKQR